MMTPEQQNQLAQSVKSFGLLARLFCWLEIIHLKRTLSKKEQIESMIYGIHKASFVLMVATDKHLHFIDKGWFHSRVEDYQYQHIESVEYDTSLLAGMVRLQAAQGMIDLRFAPNRFIGKFVSTVESHMNEHRNYGAEKSDVNQLERLAQLHKSGDLTDEEFRAEKAKIISPK